MKTVTTLILVFINILLLAQDQSYTNKIEVFQQELNDGFKSREHPPLTKKERRKFKSLDYYPINHFTCKLNL